VRNRTVRNRIVRNRIVRKTFRPKRKKVTEEWKKVYKWKLHDLFSSKLG
jgi:hypothetical protein